MDEDVKPLGALGTALMEADHAEVVGMYLDERAKVARLRADMHEIAHGKGDGFTGKHPAAQCRRIAAAALKDTADA